MKKVMIILAAALLLTAFGPSAEAFKGRDATEHRHPDLAAKNPQGEYLGTLTKALADPTGNISFVILSLEEAKGEKKDVILPVNAFSYSDQNGLVFKYDRHAISGRAGVPYF